MLNIDVFSGPIAACQSTSKSTALTGVHVPCGSLCNGPVASEGQVPCSAVSAYMARPSRLGDGAMKVVAVEVEAPSICATMAGCTVVK